MALLRRPDARSSTADAAATGRERLAGPVAGLGRPPTADGRAGRPAVAHPRPGSPVQWADLMSAPEDYEFRRPSRGVAMTNTANVSTPEPTGSAPVPLAGIEEILDLLVKISRDRVRELT